MEVEVEQELKNILEPIEMEVEEDK